MIPGKSSLNICRSWPSISFWINFCMTAIESNVLLMSTCWRGSVLNTIVIPFRLETTRTTYELSWKWDNLSSMGTTRGCLAASMPRDPVIRWMSGCL